MVSEYDRYGAAGGGYGAACVAAFRKWVLRRRRERGALESACMHPLSHNAPAAKQQQSILPAPSPGMLLLLAAMQPQELLPEGCSCRAARTSRSGAQWWVGLTRRLRPRGHTWKVQRGQLAPKPCPHARQSNHGRSHQPRSSTGQNAAPCSSTHGRAARVSFGELRVCQSWWFRPPASMQAPRGCSGVNAGCWALAKQAHTACAGLKPRTRPDANVVDATHKRACRTGTCSAAGRRGRCVAHALGAALQAQLLHAAHIHV